MEIGFKTSEVKPVGFEPLPADDYQLAIRKNDRVSRGKPDMSGDTLMLQMEILTGDYKGRKITEFLAIWDKNPPKPGKEMSRGDFARGAFRSLADACGVVNPRDVEDLHNIPFTAKVKCVADYSDPAKMKNEIASYSRRKSDLPTASTAAANDAVPW